MLWFCSVPSWFQLRQGRAVIPRAGMEEHQPRLTAEFQGCQQFSQPKKLLALGHKVKCHLKCTAIKFGGKKIHNNQGAGLFSLFFWMKCVISS